MQFKHSTAQNSTRKQHNMTAQVKNTRVSFGGEILSSREGNNYNNNNMDSKVSELTTTTNENIQTSSSGRRQQQQHQIRSNLPLSQPQSQSKDVEQNRRNMGHRRKASQSTPNLYMMENMEDVGVGVGSHAIDANSSVTIDRSVFIPTASNDHDTADANSGTASIIKTRPITRSISVSNLKRSRSELILLSPEFRTRLMNEQKERDPLFYYKIQKTIGTGSMGSVVLVKKRSQTVGGSARKNVREAVQTHKRKQRCFKLPFGIGGLFRLCIEDELRVVDADNEGKTKAKGKRGRRSGGKNALLSIETWLGSSEGSSDISSCDDSSSMSMTTDSKDRDRNSTNNTQTTSSTHRNSSILFPINDDSHSSPTITTRSSVGIEYAMKSIHLSRVTDDTFVQELKNEIAILKKLDHPHIVRPLETYYYKHQIFIVMEHCSGGDLYSRDPYTEEEAARHISSILSAVGYLHANNVAHRDLKYENILFVNESPKAEIKLIDFGLSKVYGAGRNGKTQTLTEGVGTIYTMAPEVLKGSYTKQADVWSVGVIAYMLLSSQMPFYGRKRQHIVEQVLAGKYDFRGRRWRKVTQPAKDFVQDLLVLDPDERLDAERASSCVWLNKRFAASVCGPREIEIVEAKNSMMRYAGYTKLKKMALMVVAHRSTCEEIGILRKVFQKYASKDRNGCISYKEFNCAWQESGLPPEDTRAIFDSVVSTITKKVDYEVLAWQKSVKAPFRYFDVM